MLRVLFKMEFTRIKWFLVIILAGLFLWRWPGEVTVAGEGRIKIKPETVSLVATVVESGDVNDDLYKTVEAGIARLTMAVGPGWEVRRGMFQLTPQPGGKYLLAQAISLKSGEVDKVNEVTRKLFQAGAVTVSGVEFGLGQGSKTEAELMALARQKAGEKAGVLASGIGKIAFGVKSVIDEPLVTSAYWDGGLMMIEVVKKVTITFRVW